EERADPEGHRRGLEGRREPGDLGPPRHLHGRERRREGHRGRGRPPARQDAGGQGHGLCRVRLDLQARRGQGARGQGPPGLPRRFRRRYGL
ncbi:MAG: hypothetical protein AVDCRST_MAG01-01-3793, partial [uncultured Rubrobacteraceae bacterium]